MDSSYENILRVLRISTTAEGHLLYLREDADMPRLEERPELFFQSRLHEPYRINLQKRQSGLWVSR